METYSILREFADSWFLIAMFSFFIAAAVWAFWPSQKSARDDAASIPFRDDQPPTCNADCANCSCGTDFVKEG